MRLNILSLILSGFFSFLYSPSLHSQYRSDLVSFNSQTYQTLQCPRTNDAVKSLNQKLRDLKNAIKNEAACEPIKADIEGLADLVTTERNDILSLITQGQLEGLSSANQGKVESYVQNLTVKTSNLLAVITGSDACFDEDKQGNSLEFITSLISEGSKLLTVLGGPQIGATVQIAGEVISGFLTAMDTIKQNRRGYDFSKADERTAYSESLCATFDYRKELNKLIEPYESMESLYELESVLESQLNILEEQCAECQDIINTFDTAYNRLQLTKAPEDITLEDIWSEDVEGSIQTKALRVDTLYTQRLGTHTYKALKTLTWIPYRLKALADNSLKADLGLFDVMNEMASIETFMIDDEAPGLLRYLTRTSQNSKRDFENKARDIIYVLMDLQRNHAGVEKPPFLFNWLPDELYYGQLLGLLLEARHDVPQNEVYLIDSFLTELSSLGLKFKVSSDIITSYCDFFAKANWYRDGVYSRCSNTQLEPLRAASELYGNFQMLLTMTQYEMLRQEDGGLSDAPPISSDEIIIEEMPAVVVAAPAVREDIIITNDPAESLAFRVRDITEEIGYVTRRTPLVEETPVVE